MGPSGTADADPDRGADILAAMMSPADDARADDPRLRLLADSPSWEGRPLGGRVLDLLCVLAGADGATVGDEELVAALWGPDHRPAHPRQSLQVTVSRARARIGAGAVARRAGGYALALGPGDVDALALAALARDVGAAARSGDPAGVIALTDSLDDSLSALADAGGAGPAGSSPAAAADAPEAGAWGALREEAGATISQCSRARALALSDLGRCAEAMELLPALCERRPGDEALLAALIRAEAWTGSPAAALDRYENHRRRLRERGAVPGPALRAAHEAALEAERPVRRGLRAGPDRLVGRDDDLREVEAAIATHRLVTITGPGGVGKTSLAQLTASRSILPIVHVLPMIEVSPRRPGDADADAARPVTRLARELLAALGHGPRAGQDPSVALAHALSAPATLLVLDDCEHISGALADLLAPLLATLPGLRILVTSRRSLDIAPERVQRLGPLAPGASAELFRERALAVRPGQDIDDADLERLLPALDGIPLAIELAAARTRVMSVAQVAQRLPRDLLTLPGRRDLPERQRTLASVIEWSWGLLDDSQRRAMRRLSLLADGFALETAEEVLGPGAPIVVDALVAQSLLSVDEAPPRADGAGARGPRFRMMSSVRELVRSLPDDPALAAADLAAVRAWALSVCSTVLDASTAPEAPGGDGTGTMERVLAEEPGLVQELSRALEAWDRDPASLADLEDACSLGAALLTCWSSSWGYPQLAAWAPRLTPVAATAPPSAAGARSRALLLHVLCASTWLLGPLPEDVRRAIPGGSGLDDAAGAAIRRLARAPRSQWPDLARDEDMWTAWTAGACVSSDMENAGDVEGALGLTESLLERARTEGLPDARLVDLSLVRLRLLLELGRYAEAGRVCARTARLLERSALPQRALYLRLLEMQRRCCQVYVDPTPEAASALLRDFGGAVLPGAGMSMLSFVGSEMKALMGSTRQAALDNRAFLEDLATPQGAVPPGGPWELYALATCLVIDASLDASERVGLDLPSVRRRAMRALGRALGPGARGERDLPTVATLAVAVGLAVMAAAASDDSAIGLPRSAGPVGAELLATALRVGHNQTCLLLSLPRIVAGAERVDAQALREARGRAEGLGESLQELVAHMAFLVEGLSDWL